MNTSSKRGIMGTTFVEPELASLADQQAIIDLIDQTAGWLRTKGTDQWATPWPSREQRDERVRRSLIEGATWVIKDGPTAVATITTRRDGDHSLWHRKERQQPALYVHRLVVNRSYAGQKIGEGLLGWAEACATEAFGTQQTRIDVWTTNHALHDYYQRIGFRFVRIAPNTAHYPSCALFQRPTIAG